MRRSLTLLCSIALLSVSWPVTVNANVPYTVEFEGLSDSKTLKEIKRASHLTSLHKRAPSSINALRYRADSDIPSMIKVLQANGYYEGRVTIQLLHGAPDVMVLIRIHPGPRYELGGFEIVSTIPIELQEIGIKLHRPAHTETLLQAELKVLQKLSECGYPLASVSGRDVVVDGKTKQVFVTLHIDTHELVKFGPVSLVGQTDVRSRFIERQIAWKQGDTYDSRLVDKTQNSLIDTSLFSSVLITHDATPLSDQEIPMKVEVAENKHRSYNLGVSYQTVFGPGVTFGWENRNLGGLGRTLSFQGDITRISQTGVATYLHPHFNVANQTMIAEAQAAHEDLYAYSMRSYSLMDRFEKIMSRRLRGSLGFRGDRLFVTDSAHNGDYWLLETPFYLRWSSANSLLNPTRGGTVQYTTTPTFNTANLNNLYLTQELTGSYYRRIDPNERFILAQKVTLGTIVSNGLDAVPLSNRFLGGSEEELRGYRYKTVSPLEGRKPLGGRSAIYYTLETRWRVTQTLGLVPFFDLGNVQLDTLPTFKGQWLTSAGLGFRFFTFMGPFRVDLAFPLDPRKKIDPRYKILASIGQMF